MYLVEMMKKLLLFDLLVLVFVDVIIQHLVDYLDELLLHDDVYLNKKLNQKSINKKE